MAKKVLSIIFLFTAICLTISYAMMSYSKQTVIILNDDQNTTQQNDLQVILYSKELCIYCIQAKKLLDSMSINYEIVDLTNNKDLAIKLVEKTGQNTVPFVYVNNKFIGGYTDLKRMLSNYK